jgi:glycine cleavage system H protein
MSSIILPELHYAETHEWALAQDDGLVTVGITDHAQQLLGDLVFVELPEIGRVVSATESCAVVESVKAASDVYSPLDGVIVEVNEVAGRQPGADQSGPLWRGLDFQAQDHVDAGWTAGRYRLSGHRQPPTMRKTKTPVR